MILNQENVIRVPQGYQDFVQEVEKPFSWTSLRKDDTAIGREVSVNEICGPAQKFNNQLKSCGD